MPVESDDRVVALITLVRRIDVACPAPDEVEAALDDLKQGRFTVDGGFLPTDAERALWDSATTDEVEAAIGYHTAELAMTAELGERAAEAWRRAGEFLRPWSDSGVTTPELLDRLPSDVRAQTVRLLLDADQAELVAAGKTVGEWDAEWEAGGVRRVCDDQGNFLGWAPIRILDHDAAARRSEAVAEWRPLHEELADRRDALGISDAACVAAAAGSDDPDVTPETVRRRRTDSLEPGVQTRLGELTFRAQACQTLVDTIDDDYAILLDNNSRPWAAGDDQP